ncbi:unnamed protein product [Callosobruchus maculatus]|uniref:Centrosomin N-terminal motif 1 domain-containing protein n=1 Tax=Callosobruchus maculatus TaxID=64391 RepID=A0A653BRQ7_CALMS|nr:unnamed protein product [Callosobruchus maculatus]
MSQHEDKDSCSAPDTTEVSLNVADLTSPNELQDLFSEQSTTNSSNVIGLRSSAGGAPRGRSIKEFEEQLSSLKKENFDLKLRIYFLEEKMGVKFTFDRENIVKTNVELQVELANLKKEVQDKHELLCQAAKALELQEEEHKKYIASKEQEWNMCQQELEELRVQLQEARFDSDGMSIKSDTTGFYSGRNFSNGYLSAELVEKVKLLETELHFEKENNAALQLLVGQVESIKSRNEVLTKELREKEATVKNLHVELESANERIVEFSRQLEKYEDLEVQLETYRKKYSLIKADLERTEKMAERSKVTRDVRIAELEAEVQSQRAHSQRLQRELEQATSEIHRNQSIAVANSDTVSEAQGITHRHGFVSVPDPAAHQRAQEAHLPHVQVEDWGSNSGGYSPGVDRRASPATVASNQGSTLAIGGLEEDSWQSADRSNQICCDSDTFKNKYSTLKVKFLKLRTEQMKACEIIKSMIKARDKSNEEIATLKNAVKELEQQLESVVSKPLCESSTVKPENREAVVKPEDFDATEPEHMNGKSTSDSQQENMDVTERYKILANEMEAKIEVLMAIVKEKDAQIAKMRQHCEEILGSLEDKENRIIDLEFELMSTKPEVDISVDESLLEKCDTVTEKHSSFYRQEVEEKEKEIERLSEELRKCTCYLQEIVNKELWAKNKEIGKLHSKQANSPEMQKLRKDLQGKDMQLKLLKEKISELGLDIDIPNEDLKDLTSPTKHLSHIKSLQDQLKACTDERDYFKSKLNEIEGQNYPEIVKTLKEDLDKSEKLRHDANEVCSLLNARLEELAAFLDSLLRQKSVLGFLGIHKEKKLREIINTSLDLSKSFSSFMFNPDQSLSQLSNITSLLNGSAFQELSFSKPQGGDSFDESKINYSINPENVTLTYHSHLYKVNKNSDPDKEAVISALREQIFNLQSELKLRDNELNKLNHHCVKLSGKTTETENEISTFNFSKLFTSPSKSTSTTLKRRSLGDQYTSCQSESESWSEPDRTISRARIGLKSPIRKEKQYLSESTEDECVVALPVKSKEQLLEEIKQKNQQVTELEEKLKNTELIHLSLKENLETTIANLEKQLQQAQQTNAVRERTIEELNRTIEELSAAKQSLEETYLKKDKETQNMINQLQVEKDEAQKLVSRLVDESEQSKQSVVDMEAKLSQLQKDKDELDNKLRKEYEQYAIEKLKDAEGQFLTKLKQMNNELDESKAAIKSYEDTIQDFKVKESELSARMSENQDKIHALRKELDDTTLKYSEAVFEKTQLANEKAAVEKELQRYQSKDTEFRQQIEDLRSEFVNVNQNLQQQVCQLQAQKSKLEVKISELENVNAEMKNKLVRLQLNQQEANMSMPNIGSRNMALPMYRRQCSEDESFGRSLLAPGLQRVDLERQEANSSPDLGIESDHGRFSSLETQQSNLTRPLLQTIELTESMSNLLDGDHPPVGPVGDCGEEHCCQKALEAIQENNDLKRKLLRMRRSLEETANQLNQANQRKKQVEKTICKQIHMTSQVLRKAKANLDSGSESDMLTKM